MPLVNGNFGTALADDFLAPTAADAGVAGFFVGVLAGVARDAVNDLRTSPLVVADVRVVVEVVRNVPVLAPSGLCRYEKIMLISCYSGFGTFCTDFDLP